MKTIFLLIFIILNFATVSLAENLKFKKIISLDKPWGSSFSSNDKIIITEKSGKIKIINILTGDVNEIKHNLNFLEYGQGGLLDIIYKNNNIWVSYSEDRGNWKTSTSIAKAKLNNKKLNFTNIFQANPPIDSGYHFGSRLAIKGDYLYASAGERGQGMIAQDPTQQPGSISRMHTDGSRPKNNPKNEGKEDWLTEIIQIGGRKHTGLTVSPLAGKSEISNK